NLQLTPVILTRWERQNAAQRAAGVVGQQKRGLQRIRYRVSVEQPAAEHERVDARTPFVMIAGDEDRLLPLSEAERIIRRAGLVVILRRGAAARIADTDPE